MDKWIKGNYFRVDWFRRGCPGLLAVNVNRQGIHLFPRKKETRWGHDVTHYDGAPYHEFGLGRLLLVVWHRGPMGEPEPKKAV